MKVAIEEKDEMELAVALVSRNGNDGGDNGNGKDADENEVLETNL